MSPAPFCGLKESHFYLKAAGVVAGVGRQEDITIRKNMQRPHKIHYWQLANAQLALKYSNFN